MTDDEIREALRLDFLSKPPTGGAPKLPSTQRRVETWEAAALLDKLAASVETVAPDLLAAYGSLRDDDGDFLSSTAKCSGSTGFHSWPENSRWFLVPRRASPTGQWSAKLESTSPDHIKGNGPRKDPRPLHHSPLHFAALLALRAKLGRAVAKDTTQRPPPGHGRNSPSQSGPPLSFMRAGQRICVALIELTNSFRIEPLLIDFKISTTKKIWLELLDGKTDGFGGGGEALVADWASSEFPTY